MRGTIHVGARADQDLQAYATGGTNAEESAVALCRRYAMGTPGKVYCVALAPDGRLENMSLWLFADQFERDGYRVVYSTFEGTQGVC